jgi:hypothetical protein
VSCRFTIDFEGRKPCDEDGVWIKVDFVSAVVENGTDGIICFASSSRSPVIADVGDDDFVSLVDDADNGSSSPSFCSLNVDDICGDVNSEFDFEYAKHIGHSFIICNHFPFRVRRLSWIEG